MRRRHLPFVVFTALLWGVALPAVLVTDAGGVVWREPVWVALGTLLAAAGLTLLTVGARHLASRGVAPFGVRPGAVLVTDGPYATVRNPVDIGTVLVATGAWLVLGIELSWVLPVAALVSSMAAYGPYEDRLLVEEFGDDFAEYRRTVRKWLPRRS